MLTGEHLFSNTIDKSFSNDSQREMLNSVRNDSKDTNSEEEPAELCNFLLHGSMVCVIILYHHVGQEQRQQRG